MKPRKQCPSCEVTKPLSDFYLNKVVKNTTYYSTLCKICQCAQKRVTERRTRARWHARLWERFREQPCVDCGETNPVKLSLDHVDGTKRFNISDGLMKKRATVEREIAKCVTRCHNCHSLKTAATRGWYKAPELREYLMEWPENKTAFGEADRCTEEAFEDV